MDEKEAGGFMNESERQNDRRAVKMTGQGDNERIEFDILGKQK